MMKFFKPQNSDRGFSVLEALAVLGVFGIMAAYMLPSISSMSQKSAQYADRKAAIDSLTSLISERLKYDTSCASTMSGLVIDSTTFNSQVKQIFDPANNNAGMEVTLNIPGVQSGSSMSGSLIDSGTNNLLLSRRLKVDHLRLSNGLKYKDSTGNDYILASVYLSVSEISGAPYQPIYVGNVRMQLNGANSVVSCASSEGVASKDVCQELGCVYDPMKTPSCECRKTKTLCKDPGKYLVAFKNGQPECMSLGGDDCDGTENYLVGVEIGKNICAQAPVAYAVTTTTIPATTSTTVPMINGLCGPAHGHGFPSAAAVNTAGLCATGSPSPSAVSGPGSWNWNCAGSGGGSSANCRATNDWIACDADTFAPFVNYVTPGAPCNGTNPALMAVLAAHNHEICGPGSIPYIVMGRAHYVGSKNGCIYNLNTVHGRCYFNTWTCKGNYVYP